MMTVLFVAAVILSAVVLFVMSDGCSASAHDLTSYLHSEYGMDTHGHMNYNFVQDM